MHFALMLFVLRAVCAENINIRYLHAWFPTWGRALHPTAGPLQPPYPNPTHMTLDEFDHKVLSICVLLDCLTGQCQVCKAAIIL